MKIVHLVLRTIDNILTDEGVRERIKWPPEFYLGFWISVKGVGTQDEM